MRSSDTRSFSAGVKEELNRLPLGKPCCMLSEISALTQTSGHLAFRGGGWISVSYRLDNAGTARRLFQLLKKRLNAAPKLHFVQTRIATIDSYAVFFILLLKRQSLVRKIGNAIVFVLKRIRLESFAEKFRLKLDSAIEKYNECVAILAGRKRFLARIYLLNLLQLILLPTMKMPNGWPVPVGKPLDIICLNPD